MRNRVLTSACAATALATAAALVTPLQVSAQEAPPASALINQRSQETLDAARAASIRSSEETLAYFEDEVDEALARAVDRVWDPERPREPAPRTPWGDPDLGGHWTSGTYTPLERPQELGDKALYTIEEAIEVFQAAVLRDASVDPATVHYDWTEFGMDNWQSPIRPNRRTSLIIDPPNGRIPPLTAAGRVRWEQQARRDTLYSRHPTERCVVGSEGPPRIPFIQQIGESRIIQTPDYIVLITQSNNDVRRIPIDGRAHPPEDVRAWLGVSRGRFEGDTLVIETKNFAQERTWVRPRGVVGANLHLVERLTRVADDAILYQATLTDPTTWEAPWTYEMLWPEMDPPGIFEWACHEHNYGIINVVRGAQVRAEEYEEAQSAN